MVPHGMPHRDSRRTVLMEASSSDLDPDIRRYLCPWRGDPWMDFSKGHDGTQVDQYRDRRRPFEEEARLAVLGCRYVQMMANSRIWTEGPYWLHSIRPNLEEAEVYLVKQAHQVLTGRRILASYSVRQASSDRAVELRSELDRERDRILDRVVDLYEAAEMMQTLERELSDQEAELGMSRGLGELTPLPEGMMDRFRESADRSLRAIGRGFDEVKSINLRHQFGPG